MTKSLTELRVANPYGDTTETVGGGAMAEASQAREIAEVQASLTVARRFPRNPMVAADRIKNACTRPTLAEAALYSYARGGTEITGPSIRLAESMAQNWGNLDYGVREIEQSEGFSTVMAYCWDLETNTRHTKVFHVKHWRSTRQGGYQLTDPRDIYELIANNGARRLRACILGIIPGDVTEMAQAQCEETLRTTCDTGPEARAALVEKFAGFGVSKAQIEKRIQCRLDAIRPAQLLQLRKIYLSIRDDMSTPADWFEAADTVDSMRKEAKTEPKGKDQPATEPAEEEETQDDPVKEGEQDAADKTKDEPSARKQRRHGALD